jgi:hypothetical protein
VFRRHLAVALATPRLDFRSGLTEFLSVPGAEDAAVTPVFLAVTPRPRQEFVGAFQNGLAALSPFSVCLRLSIWSRSAACP